MALAIVMIFQAIDHLNFAQGEMAMFSTFIAWQLMQWGIALLGRRSRIAVVAVVRRRRADRAGIVQAGAECADLGQLVAFHRACSAFSTASAGHIWDYTIKTFPTPFGHSAVVRRNPDRHARSRHDRRDRDLAARPALRVFSRHAAGPGDAGGRANPESARLVGIRVGWMTALGWGMAAAIGAVAGMLVAPVVFLEPNMMLGVLLYGFAGAVLGGLTSPAGAVLAGSRSASSRTWPARSSPMSGRS